MSSSLSSNSPNSLGDTTTKETWDTPATLSSTQLMKSPPPSISPLKPDPTSFAPKKPLSSLLPISSSSSPLPTHQSWLQLNPITLSTMSSNPPSMLPIPSTSPPLPTHRSWLQPNPISLSSISSSLLSISPNPLDDTSSKETQDTPVTTQSKQHDKDPTRHEPPYGRTKEEGNNQTRRRRIYNKSDKRDKTVSTNEREISSSSIVVESWLVEPDS
mmetsp:Transcript_63213/g.74750  ORF Transcript_63213/g.74750 Transcript_63213/m.74750 type:complete len:215 (-) Transcript_63213:9-653(-)